MSPSRCRLIVVCLTIAACRRSAGTEPHVATPHRLVGVTYLIDTTVLTRSTYDPSRPDAATGSYRAFQTFSARVVYAGGRGRIDVLWVRPGPVVRVDSAALTTPVARPGDYYLFDSTGFMLVRPATRSSRAPHLHLEADVLESGDREHRSIIARSASWIHRSAVPPTGAVNSNQPTMP